MRSCAPSHTYIHSITIYTWSTRVTSIYSNLCTDPKPTHARTRAHVSPFSITVKAMPPSSSRPCHVHTDGRCDSLSGPVRLASCRVPRVPHKTDARSTHTHQQHHHNISRKRKVPHACRACYYDPGGNAHQRRTISWRVAPTTQHTECHMPINAIIYISYTQKEATIARARAQLCDAAQQRTHEVILENVHNQHYTRTHRMSRTYSNEPAHGFALGMKSYFYAVCERARAGTLSHDALGD